MLIGLYKVKSMLKNKIRHLTMKLCSRIIKNSITEFVGRLDVPVTRVLKNSKLSLKLLTMD